VFLLKEKKREKRGECSHPSAIHRGGKVRAEEWKREKRHLTVAIGKRGKRGGHPR